MITLLRDVQMNCEFFSHRGISVDTTKNSPSKASRFSQTDAIKKEKGMKNTEVTLTMKFSGIAQRIA